MTAEFFDCLLIMHHGFRQVWSHAALRREIFNWTLYLARVLTHILLEYSQTFESCCRRLWPNFPATLYDDSLYVLSHVGRHTIVNCNAAASQIKSTYNGQIVPDTETPLNQWTGPGLDGKWTRLLRPRNFIGMKEKLTKSFNRNNTSPNLIETACVLSSSQTPLLPNQPLEVR